MAVTSRLAGVREHVEQRLGETPVVDAAQQDQVALAGEHPVARDRPEHVLTVGVVHSSFPGGRFPADDCRGSGRPGEPPLVSLPTVIVHLLAAGRIRSRPSKSIPARKSTPAATLKRRQPADRR
jgi:hypothetical protein